MVGLAVTGVVLAGAGTVRADMGAFEGADNPWPYADPGRAPVLAAVGDISCQPGSPVTRGFTDSTGASFTQPQPRRAGQVGRFGANGNGWYSYELGGWHIISRYVECAVQAGGCSPTGSWFASENPVAPARPESPSGPLTLAYWHQPTFSATTNPSPAGSAEGQAADARWKLLYAHHADLILNVGTGGESLDTVLPSTPNLEAWADQYYGTMKLTLRPSGYRWDYESALESSTVPAGTPANYSDTGSESCHGGQE